MTAWTLNSQVLKHSPRHMDVTRGENETPKFSKVRGGNDEWGANPENRVGQFDHQPILWYTLPTTNEYPLKIGRAAKGKDGLNQPSVFQVQKCWLQGGYF